MTQPTQPFFLHGIPVVYQPMTNRVDSKIKRFRLEHPKRTVTNDHIFRCPNSIHSLPSGKLSHNYLKSLFLLGTSTINGRLNHHFSMGKSTISRAIFSIAMFDKLLKHSHKVMPPRSESPEKSKGSLLEKVDPPNKEQKSKKYGIHAIWNGI